MINDKYSDINNPVFKAFVKEIATEVVDNAIDRLERLFKERWEAEKKSCPAVQWCNEGISDFYTLRNSFAEHITIHKEAEKNNDRVLGNRKVLYAIVATNVIGFVFLAIKGIAYIVWKNKDTIIK